MHLATAAVAILVLITPSRALDGNLGFIGSGGIMGQGMARRLLSEGDYHLVVWNRNSSKSKQLSEEWPGRVTIAATARGVIESAPITFSMLSTPEAAEQVSSTSFDAICMYAM